MLSNDDIPTLQAGINRSTDSGNSGGSFWSNAANIASSFINSLASSNSQNTSNDNLPDTDVTMHLPQPSYQYGYQNYKAPAIETHSHLTNPAEQQALLSEMVNHRLNDFYNQMDMRKQGMLNVFHSQLPAYDALRENLHRQVDITRNANKLGILTAINNSYKQSHYSYTATVILPHYILLLNK